MTHAVFSPLSPTPHRPGLSILILLLMLAAGHGLLPAKDSQNPGRRELRVYNVTIYDYPLAPIDRDVVYTYYTALRVTPIVYTYLRDTDPLRDSLYLYGSTAIGKMDTIKSWPNTDVMKMVEEKMLQEPKPFHVAPGETWYPEYYIAQSVVPLQPASSGKFLLTISLMTAGREVVATGHTEMGAYPKGDPVAAVRTIMAESIGPVYTRIREFEVKKRDADTISAANPALVCMPEKRMVARGETTPVRFSLKDCDGTPLKNRLIVIDECVQGVTDRSTVTTDEKGEATVHFTATDTEAAIAVMKYSFSYCEPWAKPEERRRLAAETYFEVEKPADKYSVRLAYTLKGTNYSTRFAANGTAAVACARNTTHIDLCAWAKNAYIPSTAPGCFAAAEIPKNVRWAGEQVRIGEQQVLIPTGQDAGNYRRQWSLTMTSPAPPPSTQIPTLDFMITPDGFFINQFVSTVPKGSDLFLEERGGNGESGSSPWPIENKFGWKGTGGGRDTVYTIATDDGALKRKETIAQSLRWSGSSLTFRYAQDLIEQFKKDSADIVQDSTAAQRLDIVIEVRRDGLTADVRGEDVPSAVKAYALGQNYPNPFNPSTTIRYALPRESRVRLEVFDLLGRRVATLVDEVKAAGEQSVAFHAGGLPSGVYFYRLQAGAFAETKRLVVVQ